MSASPIQVFLDAIDRLDVEALISLFAPDGRFTTAFGAEAAGLDQVREELSKFVGELRATQHQITAEWNPEPGTWIAETTATYELTDFSRRGPYRRAVFVRSANGLIEQLTLYGAHELPLREAELAYTNVRGPHGWMPTL